jgi:hypothetical protein
MTPFRITLVGGFTCLGIYLFATAPAPLADQGTTQASNCVYDTREVFAALNTINDSARSIYTKRVVGGGLRAGLKFGEDWKDPGVEKGPLPALFLRLTAARLETKPPEIGLYLGSDAPINASNLFSPEQMETFQIVKSTRQPAFSSTSDARQVAMYPDIASVQPCVSCHNEHGDSPKTDWQLEDVMGATTWTYPEAELGSDDVLVVIEAMFDSVAEAYGQYLAKTESFDAPVDIGAEWPDTGQMALPDRATFMQAVRNAASPSVTELLISRSQAAVFNKEFSPCKIS